MAAIKLLDTSYIGGDSASRLLQQKVVIDSFVDRIRPKAFDLK